MSSRTGSKKVAGKSTAPKLCTTLGAELDTVPHMVEADVEEAWPELGLVTSRATSDGKDTVLSNALSLRGSTFPVRSTISTERGDS